MDWTCGLDLGHCVSIHVDYETLREVYSTANLYFPTSSVDLIRLASCDVLGISDRPIVHTRLGALKAIIETSNERISALKPQVASNDVEIVAKMAQVDSLKGRRRIAEGGASLMSDTIGEQGTQLRVDEAAHFSGEAALRSAESLLQVVYMSQSSLQEHMGQLHSNKAGLKEQCEIKVRCGGRTRDLFNSATETSRNLHENI